MPLLGEEFYAAMQGSFPTCTNRDKMRLCVLSNSEMEKCRQMSVSSFLIGIEYVSRIFLARNTPCIRKINSTVMSGGYNITYR